MKAYKFIAGEPEDGTLVLGVVYHVGRAEQIQKLLEFAKKHPHLYDAEMNAHAPDSLTPIGYVGEDLTAAVVFEEEMGDD